MRVGKHLVLSQAIYCCHLSLGKDSRLVRSQQKSPAPRRDRGKKSARGSLWHPSLATRDPRPFRLSSPRAFFLRGGSAFVLTVRAEGRQQEFAVRAALGAGWTRIARELFAESILLGLAGGVLGLAVAFASLHICALGACYVVF